MIQFTRSIRKIFEDDPVGFLDNIGLMISQTIADHEAADDRPVRLTFKAMNNPAVRDRTGNREKIQCYMLTKAKPGETGFDAYIAKYKQGSTTPTTLGTAARLCFTANMNGCTFGIGNQQADGTLLVTHGNAAGHPTSRGFREKSSAAAATALQTAIQYTEAKDALGVGSRVFEPEHYRIDGKQSVTFGVLNNRNKWRFYSMSYKRENGTAINFGVNPVGTNVIGA